MPKKYNKFSIFDNYAIIYINLAKRKRKRIIWGVML